MAKSKPKMTANQAVAEIQRHSIVVHEAYQALLERRNAVMGNADVRRDLDVECGYPKDITLEHYFKLHEREGVAARVNSIYPDECWAVDPIIYEDERKRLRPFEQKVVELCTSSGPTNLLHYGHRLDLISGIGHYGGLLIGTDGDGQDLRRPLPGIDENGNAIPGDPKVNVLYFRVFSQKQLPIAQYQTNPKSSRNGQPLSYNMMLEDPRELSGQSVSPAKVVYQPVHWTRILHAADNREGSEVAGVPRTRPVFNKLLDVRKILGSSAEMLYKGGFPGISVEVDPRVLEAMQIEVDEPAVKEELFKYMNGLQRYLVLVGMNAKTLSPQVADPEGHLMAQLNSIAMSIGAPLRIFMGSEQAQLASGQDVRTWNRRLRKRQERYLTPMLLRPLIDRLVMIGALPTPKRANYQVWWPDVNMPDENEKSEIADRRAASLMKFVTSGAWKMMQPSDFYRFCWQLTDDEVKEIMTNIAKGPEIPGMEKLVAVKGPQDSGSAGKSPSKKGPIK